MTNLLKNRVDTYESRPRDLYYSRGRTFRRQNMQANSHRRQENNSAKGDYHNRNADNQYPTKCKGRNPYDQFGKIRRCRICESRNHLEKNCPDRQLDPYRIYQDYEDEDCYEDEGDDDDYTYEINYLNSIGGKFWEDPDNDSQMLHIEIL